VILAAMQIRRFKLFQALKFVDLCILDHDTYLRRQPSRLLQLHLVWCMNSSCPTNAQYA